MTVQDGTRIRIWRNNVNTVVLHGRLAKDVDLRTTPNGKSVAQTTIAVNRRTKDDGADFIPLVIWGKQAEVWGQYLSKGREVALTGRIQVRNYTDKDNNRRYITEVVVENFDFCGSKGSSSGDNGMDNSGSNPFGNAFGGSVPEEDIPF